MPFRVVGIHFIIFTPLFRDFVRELRKFVICPIHPNIVLDNQIVIVPSVVRGKHTFAIEYGYLFQVVDVLRNHIGEVEGL